MAERDSPTKAVCTRCKRAGHHSGQCYSKRDRFGRAIKSAAPAEKPDRPSKRPKTSHDINVPDLVAKITAQVTKSISQDLAATMTATRAESDHKEDEPKS